MPARLAARLATTTRELDSAIAKWLATRPAAGAKPPRNVTLLALDQQRIYRLMRSNPGLGQKALATAPARLQASARDNFAAGRSLARLAPQAPPRHVKFRTGPAAAPGQLLAWYREAERRFGINRWVLASVNFIESAFGRMRSGSYAGAQGPMQFLPATWKAYGLRGDIRDPHDAILGAANYLHASGAPGNYHRALWSYNNSDLYVDAVLRYARQMRRRSQRFYAYWSWQVFVRTPRGEQRLTGPGRTG
ncbi:MAG: lytic murein transglycosylase [Thermoleophilaceae bacterium]